MDQNLLSRLSAVTEEEKLLLGGGDLEKERYTGSRYFVVDSERMLERGKLIDVRTHTRFTGFPAHSHNYIEIMYMCSGTTRHLINGQKELVLHAGELLFLNQHVTHAIEKAGSGDIAVNFIVLPQFFDYALELIGSDNILGKFLVQSLRQTHNPGGYIQFHVTGVFAVQNLVENLIWSLVEKQPNSRHINKVTMGLLFLQLLNHTDLLDTRQEDGSFHGLVVESLKEIEENYRQASLTCIAQNHKVSLAYISGLIHRYTGKTYKQLLQEKRLAKAAQLLTDTHLTVSEVIEAVGYENTSYFYRKFHQSFHMSPKEYRTVKQVK